MRALFITDLGKTEPRDIPTPDIRDDEVLVKVEYAGICGSDLHIFRGKHEFRTPPVIIGHELAGTIVETGSAVTRFRPGDRVTVMPQISCMRCEECLSGKPMLCSQRVVPGTDKWLGAFVEYFNAPESVTFKLPDNVDFRTGVLVEPLAVSCHALGRIPEGNRDSLLILGVGTIGMLALAAAKKMGFGKVAVTDLNEYNLRRARALGAELAVNASREDPVAATRKMFGANGPRSVILTAEGETAMQQMIDCAGKSASVVYVSMIIYPVTLNTRPIVSKELQILGSRTYNREDFQLALDMIGGDRELFGAMITHTFGADAVQDGFELMESRREGCLKIAIAMRNGA